jgi:hypothetical protein
MQDVFTRCFKQMAFKYVQISECVIMPIEAVAVNSCNIICDLLYLSVLSDLTAILIDVYFSQVKTKPQLP